MPPAPVWMPPVPASVTSATPPPDPSDVFGITERAEVQAISSAGVSHTHDPARSEAPRLVIVVSVWCGTIVVRQKSPAQKQRIVGPEVPESITKLLAQRNAYLESAVRSYA